MSLLKRIEQANAISSNPDITQVQSVAKLTEDSIRLATLPNFSVLDDASRANQFRETTANALASIAVGLARPDIIRQRIYPQLYPNVYVTSMYLPGNLARLQINEDVVTKDVSISLWAVRHTVKGNQKNPLDFIEDIECARFVFEGGRLRLCSEVKVNPHVLINPIKSEPAAQILQASDMTPQPIVESIQKRTTNRLKKMSGELQLAEAETPPQPRDKKHDMAILLARHIIENMIFDVNDSAGWRMGRGIALDLASDMREVLDNARAAEVYAIPIPGTLRTKIRTIIRQDGYTVVITEERINKETVVEVMSPEYHIWGEERPRIRLRIGTGDEKQRYGIIEIADYSVQRLKKEPRTVLSEIK